MGSLESLTRRSVQSEKFNRRRNCFNRLDITVAAEFGRHSIPTLLLA
jgi:hypothetical protein